MIRWLSIIAVAFLSIGSHFPAVADENLEPYPPADPGFQRLVFRLSQMENETERRVEIFAGKMMEVDGCNVWGMNGELHQRVVDGWGYPYYVLEETPDVTSTLMLCPNALQSWEFVSAPGFMTRYNSTLPVVVYVPEGLEVRYRVWSASKVMRSAAPE